MADNSHAERVITKRARMKMRPAWSLSDRLNQLEIAEAVALHREHEVLDLCATVPGDFPHIRLANTSAGEREPE